MTRKKLKEARDYFTEKVSDVTRQLNLAGLGIIWIFRIGGKENGGVLWADFFLVPMLLLVLALGFDVAHYMYYAFNWDAEYKKCLKNGIPENEEIPNWDSSIVDLGRWFFRGKVLLTAVAFLMLVSMIAAALL